MSIASLILGLIAWCIPSVLMNSRISSALLTGSSFFCCGFAVILQFIDIKGFVMAGDLPAIEDTIGMMMFASVVVVIVTAALNMYMLHRRAMKK
ncbi:MAG: hypothetical protein Q4C40_04645 [Eubacteriales bacterium]|nr:hypothetical protein [Eubacteriales bacterium]